MKRIVSLLLALVLLLGAVPAGPTAAAENINPFAGKTVSILSHSMSTYAGVSNSTDANSTIGKNDVYYTEGRLGVYQKDTWWQQVIDALDMELLVNNSWSGSCVLQPRKGEASVGYGDRAVNLHNDHTGQEPDIIFVYLGCNDFAYFKDTYGKAADVNYAALITENDDGTFTYATPSTTCEAYAIMLHKASHRYPNASIYCITSTARREVDYAGDTYADAGQPTEYSAQLHQVAQHFGYPVIDLENAIPKDVEIFDQYIGDKRAHANALGMDQITNEVLSVMLGKPSQICHVTATNGAVPEQAALLGGSYQADVEVPQGYSITVLMDGRDVTSTAYRDGKIMIGQVTGDIEVRADLNRAPQNYSWGFDGDQLISVGTCDNKVTQLSGTVTNGLLTNGCYEFATPVVLKHDRPWTVEWKIAGNWSGMLLSNTNIEKSPGIAYITRTKGGQICFGTWLDGKHRNYGADASDLDSSARVYRLENRVAADGSNMVWLYADGVEIGPMSNYYIGSAYQSSDSQWVSGQDFVFSHIGTGGYPLSNCQLEYLQIAECVHIYQNGTCTGCGEAHPWNGKSAVFVGDSITAGVGTTKLYYQYLNEAIGFGSVSAMGIAGSCISAFSDYGQSNQPLINRYRNIPSADLIVIFMGTNDYGHETPLGTMEDTQDGTFYGALNKIIPALIAKHPYSQLVFVTPLHRYGFGTSKILGTPLTYDHIPNGVGATLGDYVAALKEVCAAHDVSVIDLHTLFTLDPADAAVRSAYLPDGLHPNAAGHQLVAGILEPYIQNIEPLVGESEPEELSELVYGNKFASGYNSQNRASARTSLYLKAGTVITLKNPELFQWSCVKTDGEHSTNNLGYFPDSAWTNKTTAVVEKDGWIGFVFKYRDESQVFDLTKPLSDYISIQLPPSSFAAGDVDGNGTVNYHDAIYLLLHTMFEAQYPLNGAYGDIDGSGNIDQDDAVYLLLHTLFGKSFYPLPKT